MDQGVYLLEKSNSQYHLRIQALLDEGVQVYACESSIRKLITNSNNHQFQIMDGVKITPSGTQLVDSLMDEGFVNVTA